MAAELKAQHNFQSRISLSESIPLSSPLVVYVEVSSFCNLSCGFCPQHLSPNEVPKNRMHLERFEEMCKQIKKFPELPKLIRFCGIGDSLTNTQFVEILFTISIKFRSLFPCIPEHVIDDFCARSEKCDVHETL